MGESENDDILHIWKGDEEPLVVVYDRKMNFSLSSFFYFIFYK